MRLELAPLIPRDGSWPAFRATAYGPDAFGQRLIPLARRWQRHRTLLSAPRVLTISFGLALLVVLGAAAVGLPRFVSVLVLGVAMIPVVALVARAQVAPPPLAAALAYDRRLDMFERLSTVVAGSRADDGMRELQRRDAFQALEAVNPSLAFPYRVPRADLGVLAVAGAALALGMLAATADVLPRVGAPAPASALAESLGSAEDGAAPALADPAVLAQIDQIRAAMAELERQRDPEAAPAALAAEAAGEALRRTAEGRRLGRALDSGDFQAAAGEARALGEQVSGMNSTRMDELADGLREASERAEGLDAGLANQLRAAAEALEAGRLADARSALSQLAQEIETVGATVQADRGLEVATRSACATARRGRVAGRGRPTWSRGGFAGGRGGRRSRGGGNGGQCGGHDRIGGRRGLRSERTGAGGHTGNPGTRTAAQRGGPTRDR